MYNKLRLGLESHSWFNDTRLSKRMGLIVEQIGNNISHSLPQSSGNRGQTEALYRFMDNDKVTDKQLYEASGSMIKERVCQLEAGDTFLCVGDTTSLNYTGTKSSAALDCLDSAKQKGMFCQSLLFMDKEGTPESLLRQAFHNRPAATIGQSKDQVSTELSKIAIEDKESYRWIEDLKEIEKLFAFMPQHRFVYILDSEGDIFELFAARRYAHIHILTRAHHDRTLVIDPKKGVNQPTNLKGAVSQTPCQGCFSLRIKDDKTNKKRQALLEIRWAKVTLAVPKAIGTYQKDKGYEPISINVVEVREITPANPDAPFKPLQWFLMTTLPVETFEQALEVIRFYTLRWRIEDFHVVLKEGCKIEKLQFETEHALRNAIVVHSIAAIQVLALRYLSQSQPDSPMQITGVPVEAYQAIALFLKVAKNVKLDIVEQPTVAQFCQLIALLGTGNSKNNGIRALWNGMRDFNLLWAAFKAFNTT